MGWLNHLILLFKRSFFQFNTVFAVTDLPPPKVFACHYIRTIDTATPEDLAGENGALDQEFCE